MPTLLQKARNPRYLTPTDIRLSLIKATDEYNDYMTRSVNGHSGHDMHLMYEEEVRKFMKEPDLKVREDGLRDLIHGAKFGKHVERMSKLLTIKQYWDRKSDESGVSNTVMQLDAGAVPGWRKRLSDPFFDDPDKKLRAPAKNRVTFGPMGVTSNSSSNELYRGLAQ